MDAFSRFFDVDVSGVDVESGIKAFPDSEELIYQGAVNRVKGAFGDGNDFSVGIKGGVGFFEGRWFDRN